MRLPSFNVRPERVVWLAAFYAATVLNIPFWKRLWIALTPDTAFDWAVLAVLLVDLTVILAFIFGVFAFRRIFKPVVAILFLLMAASSYYMLEFGAVIDRDMLRNVIETDVGEARDLISLPFMLFIATLGLFPALIVARCEMAPRPFWQELRFRALASVLSLATVAVVTYPFVGTLFSIFREHAIIRHEVSPINMIDANIGYVRQVSAVGRKAVARPVITASRTNAWDHRASKTVFVVVLGETARAQNFSLNGYDRKTNPELEKIPGLVSFSKAYSCGTATAASVPCMFSSLGRLGYTPAKAATFAEPDRRPRCGKIQDDMARQSKRMQRRLSRDQLGITRAGRPSGRGSYLLRRPPHRKSGRLDRRLGSAGRPVLAHDGQPRTGLLPALSVIARDL